MSRGRRKVGQKKGVNTALSINPEEQRMVRVLEELGQFEAWQEDVPAILKEAIVAGKDAPQLYEKFANVAAVRVIQILMTEGDSGKALSAAKELLDRHYGKATERKLIKHDLQDIPDDQLDAILLSELEEV